MNQTQTEKEVDDRPVFLDATDKPARRRGDKKSLLVFFSFVAVLALLVVLNMN